MLIWGQYRSKTFTCLQMILFYPFLKTQTPRNLENYNFCKKTNLAQCFFKQSLLLTLEKWDKTGYLCIQTNRREKSLTEVESNVCIGSQTKKLRHYR